MTSLDGTRTTAPGGCFAALPGERRVALALALVAIAWAVAYGVFLSHEPKSPSISFPASPGEPLFDAATGLNRYIAGVPPPWAPADSRGLRRAHLALLSSLTGIAVAGYALRNRWRGRLAGIVISAAVLVLLGILALAPQACDLVAQHSTLAQRLGGACGLAGLCLLAKRRKRKAVQWTAFAACIGLILLFAIPGQRVTLVYTSDWDLTEIRMNHWLYVLSHSDRLLHGARLYHGTNPSYGQLTTLANVTLQRMFGEFTMPGHLAFIVGLQTVAMLALLRAYYFLSRGAWLLCCPALVAAGCNFWLLTWLEPNHSAWRYFMLWLLPWALTKLAAAPLRRATLGAGFVGFLAVIHNVETGVAAAAGCFAFVAFRSRHLAPRRIAAVAAQACAGCALGLLGWAVLCILALGQTPDLAAALKQATLFRLMSSTGFGAALPTAIDPLALVILASCCFTLVYRLLDWRRSQMPAHAVQFAVAAAALAWFAYYANRPHREYLYGFFPLLGCLLIDQLRVVSAGLRGRLPLTATACAAVAVSWVIAPIVKQQCSLQYRAALTAAEQVVRTEPKKFIPELGVYLPDDARTLAILQKAEYLKSRASEKPVFFTVDSYLVPKLARCWSDFPVADIFWECLSERQFAAAWSKIEGGQVDEVLLDPHDWLTSNACQMPVCSSERQYLLAIRDRLARDFDLAGVEGGWELWRRRSR